MTAPIATGFPDWARQASEAQVLEINDNNVTVSTNVIYPVRYVGNAKSLMAWAQPITKPCRFALRFWGDKAATVLMDTYAIDCETLLTARQPIPILGPYMDGYISPASAGSYEYTFQLWRIPAPGVFAGEVVEAAVFSQHNTAIGGSAGASLLPTTVQEGPISWTMSMTGGNWSASLFVRDYLGQKTFIDFMDNTTPLGSRRELWVPPMTIQVDIGNNNVAAQTYNLVMSRKYNT